MFAMTVRTQNFEILRTVIRPISILMMYLKNFNIFIVSAARTYCFIVAQCYLSIATVSVLIMLRMKG